MAPVSAAAIEVALDTNFELGVSLEIFRRSGDDLLDRWDGEHLLRTLRINGQPIAYLAQASQVSDRVTLRVVAEKSEHAAAIARDLGAGFLRRTAAFIQLCGDDKAIGRLARLHHSFRPVLHSDLLVALIRCISAQQVNLRWAATTRRRLAEKFGHRHEIDDHFVYSLDATRLASADPAAIRALQFTTRKAEYIVNAARAVADGRLEIESLRAAPDDEVIARIVAIRGLGVWTAEWILARTLGRPRVSAADLGVRKAVGKVYFNGRMPSPDEVRAATAHWGAAAAFAQELLLHAQHLRTLDALRADSIRETFK